MLTVSVVVVPVGGGGRGGRGEGICQSGAQLIRCDIEVENYNYTIPPLLLASIVSHSVSQSSLTSERQTRSNMENRLRDVTAKLTTAEREAREHKAAVGEKDSHCQKLQQSVWHCLYSRAHVVRPCVCVGGGGGGG